MKSEVYSWRVSTELKTGLESEARRRKTSLSAVLDLAARQWLENNEAGSESDKERQLHIRKIASKYLGALTSGDPHRSEKTRQAVRQILKRTNEQ